MVIFIFPVEVLQASLLSTFNRRSRLGRDCYLLRLLIFHRFPQFFRTPPLPQTLSLRQLVPHCVNPATIIRITNKLSLTRINYRATLCFDSSSPSSYMECGGLPPLFLLLHPTVRRSPTFGCAVCIPNGVTGRSDAQFASWLALRDPPTFIPPSASL
jgi:hypothetical protein